MTILTILSIIIGITQVWQNCARPEAVLRRIKRGVGRDVLRGMVDDGMADPAHPLAAKFEADKESEVYKFAMEIYAPFKASGVADVEDFGVKTAGLTEQVWTSAQILTIERVKKMMNEVRDA